jgi:hypothetical protein
MRCFLPRGPGAPRHARAVRAPLRSCRGPSLPERGRSSPTWLRCPATPLPKATFRLSAPHGVKAASCPKSKARLRRASHDCRRSCQPASDTLVFARSRLGTAGPHDFTSTRSSFRPAPRWSGWSRSVATRHPQGLLSRGCSRCSTAVLRHTGSSSQVGSPRCCSTSPVNDEIASARARARFVTAS